MCTLYVGAQIPYANVEGNKNFKGYIKFERALQFPGSVSLSATDVTNVKTAYLWGNHASDTANYLMSWTRARNEFAPKTTLDAYTKTQTDSIANLKADLNSPTFTGTVSGITKAMVGLGNVTNESKATMFTSPTFTGTVTLPSTTNATKASYGNSTTLVATTSFVQEAIAPKANLASPVFTGTPSLPTGTIGVTQSTSDNSTKLATTEFVNDVLADSISAEEICPMLEDSTETYVTPYQLATAIDGVETSALVTLNNKIDNYTLLSSDLGKVITVDTTADKVITVPASTFSTGTQIDIVNLGTGKVTIAPASGVTINSLDGFKVAGKYGRCKLLLKSTNSWVLSGDVASTLNDGLVSYWDFNEPSGSTVKDKYGYNDATVVLGGTSALGSTGKIGLCPTFDGADDSISCGNPVNLQLTYPISISFWMYPAEETTDYWYPLITKIKSDLNGYAVYFFNNRIAFQTANGSSSDNTDSSPNVTELNTWYHIIVTWDGSNTTYYINGVSDGSEAQTLEPVSDVNDFFIGGMDSAPADGYKGRLDEVKIWNKVLTQSEVTEDYNSSIGKVL